MSGALLTALKPVTSTPVAFVVVTVLPLAVVSAPTDWSVAWRPRWPESGVMSKSAKVIAPVLSSRKTPVPPHWVAVTFEKVIAVVESCISMHAPPGFVIVVVPLTVVIPPPTA